MLDDDRHLSLNRSNMKSTALFQNWIFYFHLIICQISFFYFTNISLNYVHTHSYSNLIHLYLYKDIAIKCLRVCLLMLWLKYLQWPPASSEKGLASFFWRLSVKWVMGYLVKIMSLRTQTKVKFNFNVSVDSM